MDQGSLVNAKICRRAVYRSGFKCNKCSKTYSSKDNYLDLTLTAGLKEYTEVKPARTELFRYKYNVVSFLTIRLKD